MKSDYAVRKSVWFVIFALVLVVQPVTVLGEGVDPSECLSLPGMMLDADELSDLYNGRSATGSEAILLVELLKAYGVALEVGDLDGLLSLITSDFDSAMGFSQCPERISEATEAKAQTFHLIPMRVTTNDRGMWLAFIQRFNEDAAPNGYQDIFMVVAIEQPDGTLLIEFAHRDVQLADGTYTDSESIYMDGVGP